MSDGEQSVVPFKSDGFPPHGLYPEQLADAIDDAHPRRAWWRELHSTTDFFTATTIIDLEAAVGRATPKLEHPEGSNGETAVAPIFFERCACNGPGCPDCSAALTIPVCACVQPMPSLRPFDWQCAKCKGVIPFGLGAL
jgi:hypothetical protein